MAADKQASVHWEGAGKTGKGQISTETGALKDHPYGFASRFEDDKRGTNPEEILGAAHAGCLTMALAFALEGAGFTADSIDTKGRGAPWPATARASRSIASSSSSRLAFPASTTPSSKNWRPAPRQAARSPRRSPACPKSPYRRACAAESHLFGAQILHTSWHESCWYAGPWPFPLPRSVHASLKR
jgi:hypothetical protein